MKLDANSAGAATLSLGGLAGAFSLTACCGLPVLLPAIGVGTAWLAPVARATSPFEAVLPWIAGLALAGSLLLILRAPRLCAAGSLCARPAVRYGLLALTALGAALLVLWLVYR